MAALAMPGGSLPYAPKNFSTLLNLDASSDLKRFSGCLGLSKAPFLGPPSVTADQPVLVPHHPSQYNGQQLPPIAALRHLDLSDAPVPVLEQRNTQERHINPSQREIRPAPPPSQHLSSGVASNMSQTTPFSTLMPRSTVLQNSQSQGPVNAIPNSSMAPYHQQHPPQGPNMSSVLQNSLPQGPVSAIPNSSVASYNQQHHPQSPQGPNMSFASSRHVPPPQPSLATNPQTTERPPEPTSSDQSTWPPRLRRLLERSRRWAEPPVPGLVYAVHEYIESDHMDDEDEIVDTRPTPYEANLAAAKYFVHNYLRGPHAEPHIELTNSKLILDIETDGSTGRRVTIEVRTQRVNAGS